MLFPSQISSHHNSFRTPYMAVSFDFLEINQLQYKNINYAILISEKFMIALLSSLKIGDL